MVIAQPSNMGSMVLWQWILFEYHSRHRGTIGTAFSIFGRQEGPLQSSNMPMIATGREGGFSPTPQMMACTVPTAPFVKPAFVHRFEVSLKIVFLLRTILLPSPHALSAEDLHASLGTLTAWMGAIGWQFDLTFAMLCWSMSAFKAHAKMASFMKLSCSSGGSWSSALLFQCCQLASENVPLPKLESSWRNSA